MFIALGLLLALQQGSAPRQAGNGGEFPRFDAPAWTSADPFTSIASIRELSDGRVLVADFREIEVRLLSPRGLTIRTVGRVGSGPGEFRTPLRLLAYHGDTTLLLDRSLLRWLIIDPFGKALGTISFPQDEGLRISTARGFLPDGRIVYEARTPFESEDRTTPIAAIQLSGAQRESLQVLRLPAVIRSSPRGRGSMRSAVVFYSPQDAWDVAPDGAIGLARAEPFHVEWLLPNGQVVKGPVQSAEHVPVTGKDRSNFPGLPLPSRKPAFVGGESLADPFGRLWLLHYAPEGSSTRRWSVFDRRGACVGRIDLPKGKWIQRLSRLGVYVVRIDDDDLQWLELYPWAATGKAGSAARDC